MVNTRTPHLLQAMESFNDNLIGGKKLVKALERETPVGATGAPLSGENMVRSYDFGSATALD
jgi:hypothetical protein